MCKLLNIGGKDSQISMATEEGIVRAKERVILSSMIELVKINSNFKIKTKISKMK